MLGEMTSPQFVEWLAFWDLEPWGTDVEDLRAGAVCATVANMAGKSLKEDAVRTPGDFFPSRSMPPKEEPSIKDKVRAWFGGRK